MDNPQEFASVAVGNIKKVLADHLINGIQYEKINEWYEMTPLEGDYTLDWSSVMEDRDVHGEPIQGQRVYLVTETKGENWRNGLRPDKRKKIEFVTAHFGSKRFQKTGALTEVDYTVTTRA